MTRGRFFPYSLIPICGAIIIVGLLQYLTMTAVPDYDLMVWSNLFTDLMPWYLGIMGIIAAVNIGFVFFVGRHRYDYMSAIFYNAGGFFIILFTFVSWYVL